MRTCEYCGEQIEFRYVDGQRTPIHVNGNRCSGYSRASERHSSKPFASIRSYVNPNAHCPVCNEIVYFYQCPHGGRVFFDNLGWPWPKHECTDNPRSQSGTVRRLKETAHKAFLSGAGRSLTLYELVKLTERSNDIFLEFREIGERLRVFRISVSKHVMDDSGVTLKDLRNAPAFVIRFYETHRLIEFISGRKCRIDKLEIAREALA